MLDVWIPASLADWWGLSIPQTLLVLALILFVADFFIQSDIGTHAAYILVSGVIAWYVPVSPLFRVLVGLLAWGLLVWIHYSLWREFATHIVNRMIAPTKYKTGARGLIGQTGVVKEIKGEKMVAVQGDLWTFECPEDPPTDAKVNVVGERGGVLKVTS